MGVRTSKLQGLAIRSDLCTKFFVPRGTRGVQKLNWGTIERLVKQGQSSLRHTKQNSPKIRVAGPRVHRAVT
jgi:hypothetical protein